MKYSPWSEIRRVKIYRLWDAIAQECFNNGGDHTYYWAVKQIARHILDHPSRNTMLDYFEDMEDSKWISMEGNIVRLLEIPDAMKEKFATREKEKAEKK